MNKDRRARIEKIKEALQSAYDSADEAISSLESAAE